MENFKDLCLRRQACRKYNEKKVEKIVLNYILECARLAPSAVNHQPWTLYIIDSDEAKAKVPGFYNREWIKSAPLYIMCCIKLDEEWVRADGKQHGTVDISIIAEHICLAAAEQGLDSCWVCNFDVQKVREALNLPENEEPAVLIPLGYSDEPVREKDRKPLDEIVKFV